MFPSSLVVIVTGLVLGGIALVALLWAWRRGLFDALDAQARIVLDDRDLRLERPWESHGQRVERRLDHGPPLAPEPGEWGGAS